MNDLLVMIIFGIAFFLLIMLSVALHEVGHMVPAKRFGIRVSQYFVGFGPTVFSFKRGETEYGLKGFPLGGYVRLLGMYPPEKNRVNKSRLENIADEARQVEWQEITQDDVENGRLVYQKKTWQKIVIMFGGPFMNLLIAFFLFWGVAGFFGTTQSTNEVAGVQPCIMAVGQNTCSSSDPKSPAAEAGLQAGDVITAFNGIQLTSHDQLSKLIRANLDKEARITVDRGGESVELTKVNTVIQQLPLAGNDPSKTVPAGYLGFTVTVEQVKGGPVEVLGQMWEMTGQSYAALLQLPVSVWNVFSDIITGNERSLDSPMSIVGASVVAGEVAAADNVGIGPKIALFASLLGSLNLFLALLNLIPLPPLDGGHIAGAIVEGIRRQIARLRKLPDPGPIDTAKLLPITYVVASFLLICGVALIFADIVSPVRLF